MALPRITGWKAVICAIGLIGILVPCVIRLKRYAPSVANSLGRVRYYVEVTGKFPESLDQWLASGFLKCIEGKDGPTYYVRVRPFPEEEERWEVFVDFEKFSFAYGVSADELVLGDDGYVRSRRTGEVVYLIRGPDFWLFRSTYAEYSRILFLIMQAHSHENPEHSTASQAPRSMKAGTVAGAKTQ